MKHFLLVLCLALMIPCICSAPSIGRDRLCGNKVDSLLNSLTLREKIAQLIFVSTDNDDPRWMQLEKQEAVSVYGVGGVMPLGDPLPISMAILDTLHSMSKIPLLVCLDAEWGLAMRYKEYKAFPKNVKLASQSDSAVYATGGMIAAQLKELGFHVNFSPVVDVNNNPKNRVIGDRSFGDNPKLVADKGSAMMRGLQDNGIVACAKHFPGHGDTSVDSHKGLPILTISRERMDSVELVPFRRLIEDGVKMVMVGHLAVPSIDSTGVPASASYRIVTELLRNEMKFNGVIITDALRMKGAVEPIESYKAGVDILLMPPDVPGLIDEIEQEIKSGRMDERDLNDRVRRVLLLKKEAGLLNLTRTPKVGQKTFGVLLCQN